jgi:hypothetical protein
MRMRLLSTSAISKPPEPFTADLARSLPVPAHRSVVQAGIVAGHLGRVVFYMRVIQRQ